MSHPLNDWLCDESLAELHAEIKEMERVLNQKKEKLKRAQKSRLAFKQLSRKDK